MHSYISCFHLIYFVSHSILVHVSLHYYYKCKAMDMIEYLVSQSFSIYIDVCTELQERTCPYWACTDFHAHPHGVSCVLPSVLPVKILASSSILAKLIRKNVILLVFSFTFSYNERGSASFHIFKNHLCLLFL